jgi:hypothetical protein
VALKWLDRMRSELARRNGWTIVRQWEHECVWRTMGGRHILEGMKIVVAEQRIDGARRIRVLSAPSGFRRRRGAAWDEAKHWLEAGDRHISPTLASPLTPWQKNRSEPSNADHGAPTG